MLRDTWLLFRHNLRATLRQKIGIIFGVIQPLVFLVLFGPIFATIGTWETLVPGLIIQLGLMSTGMAGFGVVFEKRSGVLERMRVTPASRLALLLGRVLNNAVTLIIQAVLLVAVGYAFGLRAPAAGVVAGLVLVVVLGLSLAALSYAVALTHRRPALRAGDEHRGRAAGPAVGRVPAHVDGARLAGRALAHQPVPVRPGGAARAVRRALRHRDGRRRAWR